MCGDGNMKPAGLDVLFIPSQFLLMNWYFTMWVCLYINILDIIGKRLTSDHASVTMFCEQHYRKPRYYKWHLDNLLLETIEIKEQTTAESFQLNKNSTDVITQWEIFMAFITGVIIKANKIDCALKLNWCNSLI